MTAGDIISAALRIAGVIRTGQTAADWEFNDSIDALNRLVDNWSVDGTLVYSNDANSYSLVVGTQAYTLGPSGTLGSTRPVHIESAAVSISGGAWPVKVLNTAAEFDVLNRDGATSDLVECLYCDYAAPLATVKVWPTPSYTSTLTLHTWHVLSSFPDLTTDVTLAPGYARALEYGLALEVGPRFGLPVPPGTLDVFRDALATLKALNAKLHPVPEVAK